MKMIPAVLVLCAVLAGCTTMPGNLTNLTRGDAARQQVIATETAFAKTMADRDLKSFGSFLSEDTVFFSGPKPLHGKAEVLAFWTRFYAQSKAPFSWEPKIVEVLDSGQLALSSGPVYDPEGKLFACFSSIWRQEAPGQWKIVFDRGAGPQECDKK
jgi:ketosteroid isomerase-like protein